MENNRYAQHRQEIREISMREDVDINTACAILRHEKGWAFPEGDREITAFCRYVNSLPANLRACYFKGCEVLQNEQNDSKMG